MKLPLTDIELAYSTEGGKGPPLLCLHGLTGNRHSYDACIPHLIDHYNVFTLDHRGHGESGHSPGNYTIELGANDTAEFILQVIREPAFIWGHSMGACITLKLAAAYPDLVKAIALEDPPLKSGIPNEDALTIFKFWYEIGTAGLSEAELLVRLADKMGDGDMETLRYKAHCLTQMDISLIKAGIDGALWTRADALANIAKVQCPAFLLQADPAMGGLISEDLPLIPELQQENWKCKQYPDIGHNMHGMRPGYFCQEIHDFFSDCLKTLNV